jgi:polysaccharide biosynthesis protein PslH
VRKVLVVSQFFPYPPDHGSAVDIWGHILSLRSLGCTVDLVATDSTPPRNADFLEVQSAVRNVWFVKRTRRFWQVLSFKPFQVVSRRDLRSVPLSDEYGWALLETEYVSDILLNKRLRTDCVILRVHNDEVRYYWDLARACQRASEKLLFLLDSFKFRAFSPRVWKACHQLWFISDYERAEFSSQHRLAAHKSFFVPPRVELPDMLPYRNVGPRVLYVGSLSRAMNVEGLRWYLAEVHPRIAIAGYRFVIAGHTGGASIGWLEDLCEEKPNIEISPDIKDLAPLYAEHSVFVNPIFGGAGLKIKTVHALAAGLAVVTTQIGAEGTGLRDGEHILIAERGEEFASCVESLLLNPQRSAILVRSAQEYLRATFDQEKLIASYLAIGSSAHVATQ